MPTRFALLDAGSNPITGQASNLSWLTYVNVTNGSSPAQPAITESGTAPGVYEFDQDSACAGYINASLTSAVVQYPFFGSPTAIVFGCWDTSGVPLTGQAASMSWDTGPIYSSGSAASVTIAEVAAMSGVYRINGATGPISGVLNLGSGTNPETFTPMEAVAPTGPTISAPTPPTPGPILSSQGVSFTVTQGSSEIASATAFVTYPGGSVEFIFAPGTVNFTSAFSSSTASFGAVTALTFNRNGGWQKSPSIYVSVTDRNGLSTSATWAWTLTTPAVTTPVVSQQPSVPRRTYPYGTDVSTYVDSGDGPDLDPQFRVLTDYRRVLSEMVLRRWSTPRGGLRYDLNYGTDLTQYVNARQTDQTVQQIEMLAALEIQKDERVKFMSVQIQFSERTSTMLITGTLTPANPQLQPFQLVCAVNALTVQLITFNSPTAPN